MADSTAGIDFFQCFQGQLVTHSLKVDVERECLVHDPAAWAIQSAGKTIQSLCQRFGNVRSDDSVSHF